MKRLSLETEVKELEKSVERARGSRSEIDLLNSKIKSLTETLQPITTEVETLKGKRDELTNEVDSLTNRVAQLTKLRQSEESTIDYLRKERIQLEQQVKEARKVAVNRRKTKAPTRAHGRTKLVEHVFIGKYEGGEDWNAELAKLIAQFELTLDPTDYSASPEKIIFKVKGAPESIGKFATAINGLSGFVNLRAKLANTRKLLKESINERNVHRQQLDAVNRLPWYKGSRGGIKNQKASIAQQLAEDENKIKAIADDVKVLEDILK
jgi:uncharacterized coiled-coil DUF342 family protein